ncbi:MAG TPA: potassium channel family protein [Solirubrobacteraceae bacterium]
MRRGASRREPRHRYGVVLLLTIATFSFTLAATGDSGWVRLIEISLQAATLVAAVETSGASRRVVWLAIVISVLAILGATAIAVSAPTGHAGTRLLQAALAILAPIAVARGLRRQLLDEGVTVQVVLGALSVYLLLGMSFAFVYGAVASLSSRAFFHQPLVGDGTIADQTYFSFTTLTTTGYGDLTANVGLPRALAILEAIFGQLYLVTVVALVVSNFGRGRPARAGRDGA